jgi:hypothetical protein
MTSPNHARDPAQLWDILRRHGHNSDAWEAAAAAYALSPTPANWARYQRAEAAFLVSRREVDAAVAADALRRELKRAVEGN